MRTSVASVAVAVNTHIATHGGESVECNADNMDSVCDGLIRRHGPGVPRIEPKAGTREVHERVERALELFNGFQAEPQTVSLGTDVSDSTMKSALRSQRQHEAKPYAQELAREIVEIVRAESRVDLGPALVSQTRMRANGLVATSKGDIVLNERAFRGLVGKFPCANGAAYLADCPPDLRAKNYNHWATYVGENKEAKDSNVVFRTREIEGQRHAFAVVSPGYTAFDTDQICSALADAFPSDARGSADYDGERLRFEGLWHADVNVELPRVNEVFKAGVVVRSDDTGGGSVVVRSVMWRARCRNLMIFDKAIGVDTRLRHSGNKLKLVAQFKKAFDEALTSVNAFRTSWLRAADIRDRDFLNEVQGTTSENLATITPESALLGIFNGIVERELVPVRGRAKDVVPKLLHMHSQDEARAEYGVSRASVVNAFTRFAHQVETDPFAADRIRMGATNLLSGTRGRAPAPLPYVAFSGRV